MGVHHLQKINLRPYYTSMPCFQILSHLTLTSTGNSIYLFKLYWAIQISKHSFSIDSERPRKSIYIIPGNLGSKFTRDKKAKNGNAIAIYLAKARA